MSLSARLHAIDRETQRQMRRQITGSIRAGESISRTAERLLDIDNPVVNLPEHVRELRAAANRRAWGGPAAAKRYEQEVAVWRQRIERLGQGKRRRPGDYTMRSATQELVKRLRTAKVDEVDKHVERWVIEKARYQARRIARSETVEAFRDVYRKGHDEKPYVVGYRWTLSPTGHPEPDICDVLAHQNLHGLGPGGYPKHGLPSTPHPHDLCAQVAIIDTAHFKRQTARAQGRPEPPRAWEVGGHEDGNDWLRKQSPALQRRLLGPTRAGLLQHGVQVMRQDGGDILPVHVLTGRPRPQRNLGPAVQARPLVRADRAAGQVAPFPTVRPAG